VERVERHRSVEPHLLVLAFVPPLFSASPRRIASRLGLVEEAVGGVRPPHMANVRKREREAHRKHEDESPERPKDSPGDPAERLRVCHEHD
jgi:hypothetical protein